MSAHEFTAEYSEPQVRQSVRTFFIYALRKRASHASLLLLVVTVLGAIYVAVFKSRTMPGVAVSGLLLIYVFMVVSAYRSHLRHALERLRDMGKPIATVRVTNDDLSLSSALGASTVPWRMFEGFAEDGGSLILVVKGPSMIAIPKRGVPADALQFMRERVSRVQGDA